MSQMHPDHNPTSQQSDKDEIEKLLLEGVSLHRDIPPAPTHSRVSEIEDDEEDQEVPTEGDLQGSLGLFAEAAQDMATAGVELGIGRHFACVDFCNQAVEKAAQSVSLLRFGRRSSYNHDLRALGERVNAPLDIQDEMAKLTPFHPEAFYAETPPEEADEVINAEQASSFVQSARRVMRWARSIVLQA